MKGNITRVVFLLAAVGVVTASEQENPSLGVPYFEAVTPAYPTDTPDKAKLSVIVKVPNDAIQFLKKGNSFEAKYELAITLQDADDNQVEERIRQHTVETGEYKETISSKAFDLRKQMFYLTPAKYRCIIELTDKDIHKSGRQTIELDLSRFHEDMVLGDLLLVDPAIVSDDFPRGIPVVPSRITDADSLFHVYYEARIPPGKYTLRTKIISAEDDVLSEEAVIDSATGPMVAERVQRRHPDVGGTKFKLTLEIEQEGNVSKADLLVDVRWLGLTTHVLDLDEAIEQIRYIARRGEVVKIKRAKKSKREDLFKEFWKERDPSPNTPENELMDEYYRRVNYANEKFGTFRDGWKTPMGMIFVMFGPPDDIEVSHYAPPDGRSYQRWHYYAINRSFLFVDYNGFGDYELLDPYYRP